ncbi:MAG: cation transporter [Actinomycetota bacterium]
MTTRRVTLPAPGPAGAAPVPGSPEWLRLARLARGLSWLSLAWMGAEGAIAILAGVLAGSIALIGFGIDSAIEGVASVVVIWRFTGRRTLSPHAERRAQVLVAAQFFLLAPYVATEAVRALADGSRPDASPLGIGLSISSLVAMPLLGVAKRRIGERLGSAATRGEGAQNLLCAALAAALLAGLLGNALLGLWWLDPAVALLVAAVAVKEGVAAWRGEACDCAAPAVPACPQDGCCGETAPPATA